jgi:hypothetical protein
LKFGFSRAAAAGNINASPLTGTAAGDQLVVCVALALAAPPVHVSCAEATGAITNAAMKMKVSSNPESATRNRDID